MHILRLGEQAEDKLQHADDWHWVRRIPPAAQVEAGCIVCFEDVLHCVLCVEKGGDNLHCIFLGKSRRQVLANKLHIVRLGEQAEDKLQNADELQCVRPTCPQAICWQGHNAICHVLACREGQNASSCSLRVCMPHCVCFLCSDEEQTVFCEQT